MKLRMSCREFTDHVAAGDEQGAPLALRLRAVAHQLVCADCRRFAHNQTVLNAALQHWRARHGLSTPDAARPPTDGKAGGDTGDQG